MVKRGKKKISRGENKKASLCLVNKTNVMSKSKRSQEMFGMSFGMIFAVILIIFFVFVAIIVINQFMSTKECAQTGMFFTKFNDKVQSAFDSIDMTVPFKVDLPTKVDSICFANLTEPIVGKNKDIGNKIITYDTKDNLFLYTPNKKIGCDLTSYNIDNLDLDKIIGIGSGVNVENPYCIKLIKGKGVIVIDKQNNEKKVTVERE